MEKDTSSNSSGSTEKLTKGLQGAAILKPIGKPLEPVATPKSGSDNEKKETS